MPAAGSDEPRTHPLAIGNLMNTRTRIAFALAASLIALGGCAVTRGQETVGGYVDDTAITTSVKARFVENRQVDASSIKVETLNGTVLLSGFAKNNTERTTAESIAREVGGVRMVRNEISVRP
jgi:osmotically-inducible protein OsmY